MVGRMIGVQLLLCARAFPDLVSRSMSLFCERPEVVTQYKLGPLDLWIGEDGLRLEYFVVLRHCCICEQSHPAT